MELKIKKPKTKHRQGASRDNLCGIIYLGGNAWIGFLERCSLRSHKDRFIVPLTLCDVTYSHMSIWVDFHTLLDRSIISTRRPVSTTEYQEPTRMLYDLSWSGWRGCYVILHVKPLDFGHVRAHFIIVYFDDLV